MSFFDNPGMLAPPRVTRIDLSRGGLHPRLSRPPGRGHPLHR